MLPDFVLRAAHFKCNDVLVLQSILVVRSVLISRLFVQGVRLRRYDGAKHWLLGLLLDVHLFFYFICDLEANHF